ncbi:MAG TPA: cupin domain-containing protein [Thermoanaerobaculia bacterium]|nr:cupin domain-containing protein [Thermoanaerobaculia bacterium]
MRIHADLTIPAIVRSNELPWTPSPMRGVDRRMLERDGEEVARATSLVRYAPHSRFSQHVHGGGEELLVLEGAFSDEHGEFPAGSYLRNPVSSSHSPRSEDGCVLFVKLHWMHADDRQVVRARLDEQAAKAWKTIEQEHTGSVSLCRLHAFREESTSVCRLEPGSTVEGWAAPDGLELLVLAGACQVERQKLGRHGWARMPAGCAPRIESVDGAFLLLKQGHLRSPPPLPKSQPRLAGRRP